MCPTFPIVPICSYQIGFLDAEFTCGRCRILVAEIMWLGLLPAVGAWIFWSHDLYPGSWNLLSLVFWVFHTAFFLPCTWWCLTAAVRTLRTCLCCHLAVCFFQGLHRAGPTSHVHCRCWMMLNDSEYLLPIVVNIIQYHSISIQYLFKIYIYLYLCIFTLFNIYLYYIICIKLLTPATAWSLRRCWPGPGSLASQSGNVFQSSRGLSFTRRWDHGIPVGLKTLRSWEDHWKTLKTYQDISRHYEKSAAYITVLKWEKRWKEHVWFRGQLLPGSLGAPRLRALGPWRGAAWRCGGLGDRARGRVPIRTLKTEIPRVSILRIRVRS